MRKIIFVQIENFIKNLTNCISPEISEQIADIDETPNEWLRQ